MPVRTTLYQQVEAALRSQIVSGQRAIGSRLPTENAMADMFNVSRDTVRKAIRSLKDAGLVKATPGVGTVVVRNRPDIRHATLLPLSAQFSEAGLSLDFELLDIRMHDPSDAVREYLRLAPNERVLRVQRAHKIAARPFSIMTHHVPEWVGIGIDADLSGFIYELIEKTRTNFITYGTDRISARMPTDDEKRILAMPEHLPLLIARRTAYTDQDRPIQYIEAAIRSDHYEYVVTLPRKL